MNVKGFLLLLVAVLALIVITPVALVVSLLVNKLDFMAYAVSIDQTINAIAGNLLNHLWLIDKSSMTFGDMDKTISYNLGKNKKHENLNRFGLFVCDLLHFIDENHVEKAYKNKT